MDAKDKKPDAKYFKFFSNVQCEYFPCHETDHPESFNCIFCFCPAYALGDQCGGLFSYDNESGVKDCSGCLIPHLPENYELMVEKAKKIVEHIKETQQR